MTTVRRCLAMTVGATLVASVLFAAGVPGAVLLVVTPALVCVAIHLVMGHGHPDGRQLLDTAQRSVRPSEE
jgi:hypothetical protein